MELRSGSFEEGGPIPEKYTCDGSDISPDLEWWDVPDSTETFVMIVHDPDAPVGDWLHWMVWNIPGDMTQLIEDFSRKMSVFPAIRQGFNDFKLVGYGGPCPPSGTHRYFFDLYALNTDLSLLPTVSRQELEQTMQPYVLEKASSLGLYSRVR